MKNRVFFCAIILGFNFPVNASDQNSHYALLGRGTASCGSVVEAYDKSDKLELLLVDEWINGYLTAINASTPKINDLTDGIDRKGRSQWVLKYCRENPLKHIGEAAELLVLELRSKM